MRRLSRQLLYLVVLSFLALLMLTPAAGAQGNQRTVTVSIRDFFFDPARITVEPGTTVRWVNRGNHPHTVTADDGSFDSEVLNPGDSFMVTFRSPGTVAYHCEIHPFRRGSVTVSKKGTAKGGATFARAGGATAIARGGASEARAGGVVARSRG